MKPLPLAVVILAFVTSVICDRGIAADAAAPTTKPAAPASKPSLKIIPGKVIVPFDNMRRPWGELISIDPATRTGKFRHETTNEVMPFTILPYAELLHHATFGDVQDFRVGERVIFRLHPNDAGEWVWLTYIQDEMNMMLGHGEYYLVDAIDAGEGKLTVTQGKRDKSYIRETNIPVLTDAETRYWKAGQPARFTDIKIGDALRTKTHGRGEGKVRVAWDVFLDDESLLKFQSEQKAVHAGRMTQFGAPGYVDEPATPVDGQIEITCFQESLDYLTPLKPGRGVFVAPAGTDRNPTAPAVKGTVVAFKKIGKQSKATIRLERADTHFSPASLVRVWVGGT